MKHFLSLLFIILISTSQIVAQQRDYYDCVAYGFNGHVKQALFRDSNNSARNHTDYFNKDGSVSHNPYEQYIKRDQNGYILRDHEKSFNYKDGHLCETSSSYDGNSSNSKFLYDNGQVIQQDIIHCIFAVTYNLVTITDTIIEKYTYSNIVEDNEGNWISRDYTYSSYASSSNERIVSSGTETREIVYYWSEHPSPLSKDNRKRVKLDEIQFNDIDVTVVYGEDMFQSNATVLFSLEEIAPRGSGEYHMVVRLQDKDLSTKEDFMLEDIPVNGSSFKYLNNEDFSEYYFSFNTTKLSFKLKDKLHSYKELSQLEIRSQDDDHPNKEILILCGVHVYSEKDLFDTNPIQLFFSNCQNRFNR